MFFFLLIFAKSHDHQHQRERARENCSAGKSRGIKTANITWALRWDSDKNFGWALVVDFSDKITDKIKLIIDFCSPVHLLANTMKDVFFLFSAWDCDVGWIISRALWELLTFIVLILYAGLENLTTLCPRVEWKFRSARRKGVGKQLKFHSALGQAWACCFTYFTELRITLARYFFLNNKFH